jgi:hypothetical protein
MAETYQGNDFDYTGLHAFVFIDGVDPGGNVADVVEALGGPDAEAAGSPTGGRCSRRCWSGCPRPPQDPGPRPPTMLAPLGKLSDEA